VACETLVTTGLVVCSGEVRTQGFIDIQHVARETIKKIGYTKAAYKFDADSCGVISTIHEQSQDIYQGVVKSDLDEEAQGAGDQGMMFGMASNDMENMMPMPIELAHVLVQTLAEIRKEGKEMTYLRPDSKSQVTIEYDDHGDPVKIHTVVVSTQHDEFIQPENQSSEARIRADKQMQKQIKQDVMNILIPRALQMDTIPQKVKDLFSKNEFILHANPSGKFVIGGPHGDSGLTGRKIVVDTYGGISSHGGGAFSGKDASKVDRSAAYAARHIAKNLVKARVADEVHVQVAYAIGEADPVSLFIDTRNTARVKCDDGSVMSDGQIAEKVKEIFDLRPYAIIKKFGLKNPVFSPTSTYGHFGREPYHKEMEVYYEDDFTFRKTINGEEKIFKKVEFFAWEKLDKIEDVKQVFGI
jgi:S-adenosylmethionine synthetase